MKPKIYDAANTILAQKLSQIEGIGQVFVAGGSPPAVRIEINPTLLNNFGLGLDDVRTMLSTANANRPKGHISTNDHSWFLSTDDQLLKSSDYRPLIIAYRNGAPVRISDVGTVSDSVEDIRASGFYSPGPGVIKPSVSDDHLASARGEHHRCRRPHPSGKAAVVGRFAAGDGNVRHRRPDHDDPRFRP